MRNVFAVLHPVLVQIAIISGASMPAFNASRTPSVPLLPPPTPTPTVMPNTADLVVSKFDSPDPVQVGSPLTYTVHITNSGPHNAPNVLVTDTMPASVSYNFATVTQGSCAIAFQVLTCNLTTLNATHSAALVIRVTPNVAGSITNTVRVTTLAFDPAPGNNRQDQATTVIEPQLHLPVIAR